MLPVSEKLTNVIFLDNNYSYNSLKIPIRYETRYYFTNSALVLS